jgi:hypothetical protein
MTFPSGARILACVIVLEKKADPPVRMLFKQILGKDVSLGLITRIQSHGPWKMLRIVPFAGARSNEQLRDFLVVHVLLDGGVRRRAKTAKDEQHSVALDQLAHLLARFWRAVSVVVADEINPTTIDPAFYIDLVE